MIQQLLKPVQWIDALVFPDYTEWQLEEVITVDSQNYDPQHDLHLKDAMHAKRIYTVKFGVFSRINKKNNHKQYKQTNLTYQDYINH